MSKEYEQMHAAYADAQKKGDMAQKAKIMGEIRQAERESARKGVVLNPVMKGGKLTVQATETSSKRSLQEEYVRKFDDKIPVPLSNATDGTVTATLRGHHAKRLLKRA